MSLPSSCDGIFRYLVLEFPYLKLTMSGLREESLGERTEDCNPDHISGITTDRK